MAKAYRRQLSKHHPDKLKANGLPDSMLEHAKQRTQQIIEAYELDKVLAAEVDCRAMQTPWIAPSILSADFARLGDEVNAVLAAGADVIHFDVMDNHYVPNLTIGPMVCEALRKYGITAPLDVHLMVKPVDRIVPDFAKAGATYISFHPEASEHVDRTIELIREHGCKPGLVLNPATPLDCLDYTLHEARPGAADVGEPGLRRAEVHPRRARQGARRAQAHRCAGQADPPRDRRRREGGQHRRDRARRRGHVRRGLGDLRREGLQGDDRCDAGAMRGLEGRSRG